MTIRSYLKLLIVFICSCKAASPSSQVASEDTEPKSIQAESGDYKVFDKPIDQVHHLQDSTVVFRGDRNLTIEQAFSFGIKPKGEELDIGTHVAGDEDETGFISTSLSEERAKRYQGGGFLYKICVGGATGSAGIVAYKVLSDHKDAVEKKCFGSAKVIEFAKNDREILVEGAIPRERIMGAYDGIDGQYVKNAGYSGPCE